MKKEYNAEVKSEVIERVVQLGEQIDKVATELGVSRSTLQRWVKKYQELPEDPLLQDIRLEDTKKPGKNISIYLHPEELEELEKFMKKHNFKNRSLCIRKTALETIKNQGRYK